MDKKPSFWTTLPGLLTGCAAIITAIVGIGGLLAALVSYGFIQPPFPTPTPASAPESPAAPTIAVKISPTQPLSDSSPTPTTASNSSPTQLPVSNSSTAVPFVSNSSYSLSWTIDYSGVCRDDTGEYPRWTAYDWPLSQCEDACKNNPNCQGFAMSKERDYCQLFGSDGINEASKPGTHITRGDSIYPQFTCFLKR